MTNTKLDFEAARELSNNIVGSEAGTGWINLAACYLALLQKTETLKEALDKACYCHHATNPKGYVTCFACEAIKEFEEIKP